MYFSKQRKLCSKCNFMVCQCQVRHLNFKNNFSSFKLFLLSGINFFPINQFLCTKVQSMEAHNTESRVNKEFISLSHMLQGLWKRLVRVSKKQMIGNPAPDKEISRSEKCRTSRIQMRLAKSTEFRCTETSCIA